MWWSRAALLLALAVLGPGACGFEPMYAARTGAAGSRVSEQMALIRVMPIADRSGQELRNLLLSRLTPGGEPANYRYILTVRLDESLSSMGFQKDASSTLGKLTASVGFTLSDTSAEKPVSLSGSLVSESSFDYEGPRYGSVAMERDARTRVLSELADRISNQVGGMLARMPSGPVK